MSVKGLTTVPTDSVWWDDTHVNLNQQAAMREAFFSHVVGVFPADGHIAGTGTLIEWRDRQFILTAAHVLEDAKLDEVRFHTRPEAPLEEMTPEEALRKYGHARVGGEHLDLKGIVAESDKDHDDLAVLELASCSQVDRGAVFYRLEDGVVAMPDGAVVFTIGYALDNSLDFAPGYRGIVSTGDLAMFSSGDDARSDLPSSYNPTRQFLLPYTRTNEGIKPFGISGTGAWGHLNRPGGVWTAWPLLVGVVTRWHRKQNLLQITRLEPVLELFRRLR